MSSNSDAVALAKRGCSDGERLLQIRYDVVLVFEADRQPHDVRTGARLRLLRVGELAMRGRSGMYDQRSRVADIGKVRKQPHVRDELDAGIVSALETEREHRTCPLRHVFLREIVV